ncbi:MAG: SCP-like extracellular [Thermoleophilia bacterium]|nr:SCP-like extracellular [Thermoleophilia bacterium]
METRTATLQRPRRSNRIAAALALLTIATTALLGTTASAQAATIDRTEATEVRMINQFRRSHGMRPLRIDGTLTRAAGWVALDLGRTGRFSHTDSQGRDPFDRLRAFGYPSGDTYRGENLAAGNAAPRPTYLQWLNSPPHKANWMNPRFRAIGIARVHVNGSPYQWYWATTFGSRWTNAAG